VLLFPALGGEADQVGLARPRPTGAGGVQAVATDQVGPCIRKVLQEVDEKPDRGEQLLVCLEVRIGLMLTLHLLCRSGAKESDLIVQHLDA
jgi:hypothetical protein